MRFFATSCLILISLSLCGQDSRSIDSLKQLLPTTKGVERFDVLYELVFEHLARGNNEAALSYVDEARNASLELRDSLKIVKTGRVKGQILRRLDRTAEAIQQFKDVLPVARRNNFFEEYKDLLHALAIALTFQANYDEALQYYFEVLVLREKDAKQKEIMPVLNNIGLVYFDLKDYEKAMKYYQRVYAHLDSINFKESLLINMGLCYNSLKDYANAQRFIDHGMKLCSPNCNSATVIQGEFGLGVSLYNLMKPADAEKHFTNSLQIAREQNNKRFQIENLIFLARIRNDMGDDAAVNAFLSEAESMAKQTTYNELTMGIYLQYSTFFNRLSDYKNAAYYQERYIKLRDSIYSEDLIKNLAKVQTNYEERENLKTIADQDIALELKEETLKRQRAENVFYAVTSVLVFALAGAMLVLFRLTRRANERLEERVEDRTKELNDSNDALMKVNGEMDNFIYKTSHDIRGPLASLKGICNVAIMDTQDPTALGYLKKLDNTADKLNMILTRLLIINQINHAVMAPNAINFEELIEEILVLEHKKGIPKRLDISYKVDKGFVMKSDKDMLRIVLENLIDNGIKFYNESDRVQPFVRIHIGIAGDRIAIAVTDNGVGINDETKEKIFHMFVRASERSETGGIGLYLSKLATERLGGTIDFTTTEDKLTSFTVLLPLDLGPILERRREQEKIRDFERSQSAKEKKTVSAT